MSDGPNRLARLKAWARGLKRDVLAVSLAARDPRVPWPAKLLAAVVVAYALSPIDLIPDFIPVIGYVDDLLLVPLGLWLVIRLIPAQVLAEHRKAAETMSRPRSWAGAVAVVAIWLVAGALVIGYVLRAGSR